MLFSVEEVLKVTGGVLGAGKPDGGFQGATIDSRAVKGGELFFPLQGEKVNGHDFIFDALERGASGSLLERRYLSAFKQKAFPEGKTVILVEDSLRALQELARKHRSKFLLPLVAVTGSNGKTTTKDFIASVLSTRYNVLKTEGNLNNHLGLPLMLLRLRNEHQAAVLELGMSGIGEIALLASLAKPDLGVITNVGEAHVGLLGSKENIARAKGELLAAMGPRGKAFLNGDDPALQRMGKDFQGQTFYYGFAAGADLRALKCFPDGMGLAFEALLPSGAFETFFIPLPGKYNVYNALAAIAVGLHFSLTPAEIKAGLSGCSFSRMRSEMIRLKSGIWLLNDAYNANPTSMKAALQALKETAQNNTTIAVLGDMLELGPKTKEGHLEVGAYLAALGIDFLVTVGRLAADIARGAKDAGLPAENIIIAHSCGEAVDCLGSICSEGSFILIKGSRGMRMEEISAEILARYN